METQIKGVRKEDFSKICRCCMSSLFDHNAIEINQLLSSYELPENIRVVGIHSVKELLNDAVHKLPIFTPLDDLPKSICPNCLDRLLKCKEFQQMCINSDNFMRLLLLTNANIDDIKNETDAKLLSRVVSDSKWDDDPLFDEKYMKTEVEHSECKLSIENANISADEEDETNYDDRDCNLIGNQGDSNTEDDNIQNNKRKAIYKPATKPKTIDDMDISDAPQSCSECLKIYANRKCLLRHVERVHKTNKSGKSVVTKTSTKTNQFKCEDCGRSFAKEAYMRQHKTCHSRPGGLKRQNKCDQCGECFKTILLLRQHKLHHIEEQGQQDQIKSGLIIDPMKPYICDVCKKAFRHPWTLRDHHLRVHTKEQPYLCSECGKGFNTSSNLQQHLLRHTGEKRYECPECPKKFPCLSDLSCHKKVHKKLRPYVCDLCGAAFGRPYHLKKHKMHHAGIKPYKCEHCEKCFVTGDHMRRHMRTHTGEKPYKCRYCERAFVQSNELMKHLRIHLGENVYKCEMCPKGFPFASALREHLPKHKNEDDETRERNRMAIIEEENNLRSYLKSTIERVP